VIADRARMWRDRLAMPAANQFGLLALDDASVLATD